MKTNNKDSIVLRFLYNTVVGRFILKLLVHPSVSKVAGVFLSSRISTFMIPSFIRNHDINMDDIEIPKGGFSSFNEFFSRKRKEEELSLPSNQLISPCDGFLTTLKITKDTCFEIKHTQFSLKDLLKDEKLASKYENGTALIFRLTPANYHRYCYPTNGKILTSRKIKGILHCVRPIALRNYPVFVQNSREYQVIKTEQFGTMVQMEIGALLVGKIVNHIKTNKIVGVVAGQEKGYFQFGGSTIVLLFQKDTLCMDEKFSTKGTKLKEISVRKGEFIAKIK